MANGSNGFPKGFFVGGSAGVALSNTAIVFGGLALITLAWLTMNRGPKIKMDDETLGQIVESDVLAYAATPTTAENNRDRIRAAINRIRDTFRVARENFIKKIHDLVAARRAGTITNDQFRVQIRAAVAEFHTAIRQRHAEIMHELGIPKYNSDRAEMVPTMS